MWAEASFTCELKQSSHMRGSKLRMWAEASFTHEQKSLFKQNVQSCVPTNVVFFWQEIELWWTTCWCRAQFLESCVSCVPTFEGITPLPNRIEQLTNLLFCFILKTSLITVKSSNDCFLFISLLFVI